MAEKRSLSQIQFGYLPQQTVDVKGGIWKVEEWSNAEGTRNIDERSLRRELARLAAPWSAAGTDGGFYVALAKKNAPIVVKSVNPSRGVHLKPFPEIWYCRNCRRVRDTIDGRCKCGDTRMGAQIQFVAFSEDTGELREPRVPQCSQGHKVRITLPGTATGSEVKFDCIECSRSLGSWGFQKSSSGSRMSVQVHRAAAVFAPRSVVVVNPPSAEVMERLHQAGGGARALSWVLDGMPGRSMLEGKAGADVLRKQLAASGLDADTVEKMIAVAGAGDTPVGTAIDIADAVREEAEQEAMNIAVAMAESRTTIADMSAAVDPLSPMRHRYDVQYAAAMHEAGVERIELLEKFPILTGHFGFTRGRNEPGVALLNTYRDKRGTYEVYGEINTTEALYVGLDPIVVARWLRERGHSIGAKFADRTEARKAILQIITSPEKETDPVLSDTVKLIHSYAHRLIRLAAVNSGIELHALSELLLPMHLGFFVYAATRGDFVLGGLQALFENDLNRLLTQFVEGEHRCALDPGCSKAGGACVACLHLGEPSCRLFNGFLDRHVLAGPMGYLAMAGD